MIETYIRIQKWKKLGDKSKKLMQLSKLSFQCVSCYNVLIYYLSSYGPISGLNLTQYVVAVIPSFNRACNCCNTGMYVQAQPFIDLSHALCAGQHQNIFCAGQEQGLQYVSCTTGIWDSLD